MAYWNLFVHKQLLQLSQYTFDLPLVISTFLVTATVCWEQNEQSPQMFFLHQVL